MTDPGGRYRRRRRGAGSPAGPPPVAAPAEQPPPVAAPAEQQPPAASPAEPGPADEAPTPRPAGRPSRPARRPPRPPRDSGERGLRDLAGAGPSQVGVSGALRARDLNRPTDEDLAEAEEALVVVRRHWTPPDEPRAKR